MNLRHDGRVAVVTGAANGIGRGVAQMLADGGATVALLDADPAVAQVAQEVGAALGCEADVTDERSVAAAFGRVREQLGGVAILVNCAGVVHRRDGRKVATAELELAAWRWVLDVNLTGVFLCARAALDDMRAAGWGRIVSISSQGGRTGGVFSSVDYGASKAGVIGLSRTLAAEVGPHGITVNCVAPGRVETAMTAYASEQAQNDAYLSALPVPRMARVEEVAAAVAFLSSELAGYVTGATLDVNGGGFMA